MDYELFSTVDSYLENLLVGSDEALEQALRASAAAELPAINVSPSQGKFLSILATACQARRILEIGALGGYSTIWLAQALPPGGRLITLELEPRHATVARENIKNAGVADRVELREGRAVDSLAQLVAEGGDPFDFIFIDADKPGYVDYLEWSLRLARPGTLIVADNVVRQGAVVDPSSEDPNVQGVRRFLAALAAEPRVTATALQLVGSKGYDGMALAVVRE